jgi:hypothetical protein
MRSVFSLSGVFGNHALHRAGVVCAVAAISGLIASFPHSATATDNNESRVQSWAVGHITPLPANTAQYNNQTLRAIVHTSVGGDEVRVRVANTFGTSPCLSSAQRTSRCQVPAHRSLPAPIAR